MFPGLLPAALDYFAAAYLRMIEKDRTGNLRRAAACSYLSLLEPSRYEQ